MPKSSENYHLLRDKLKNAKTLEELERADQSCTRVYNAGQITVKELQRLYDLELDRRVALSDK